MAVLELRTWRAPVRFFLPVSMVRIESWSGVKPTAVSRAAILPGNNDYEGEERGGETDLAAKLDTREGSPLAVVAFM